MSKQSGGNEAKWFKGMIEFAERKASISWEMQQELARDKKYVRISSTGMRLISLDPKNPCGSLCRTDRLGARVGSVTTAATIFIHAANSKPCERGPSNPNKKPELGLQAAIIRKAIQFGGDQIIDALSLHDLPERWRVRDLKFVTDEFSVQGDKKDIRADLIFLGSRDGATYFPVFIELKARPDKETVTKQLNNINREWIKHREQFLKLFKTVHEEEGELVVDDSALLLAITGVEKHPQSSAWEQISIDLFHRTFGRMAITQ